MSRFALQQRHKTDVAEECRESAFCKGFDSDMAKEGRPGWV